LGDWPVRSLTQRLALAIGEGSLLEPRIAGI
jgi:hypothetical protein